MHRGAWRQSYVFIVMWVCVCVREVWALGLDASSVRMPCRLSSDVSSCEKMDERIAFRVRVKNNLKNHLSERTRTDIEHRVKNRLLKENNTALQPIKPKEFLKTQTGYIHRGKGWIPRKWISFFFFFLFSVCRWGWWSKIGLTEAALFTFPASFSDCSSILRISDDSDVLATSAFFHRKAERGKKKKEKELFIILPITQPCLSSVIKQRERSQSKFAFFRSEWTQQAEGMHFKPRLLGGCLHGDASEIQGGDNAPARLLLWPQTLWVGSFHPMAGVSQIITSRTTRVKEAE